MEAVPQQQQNRQQPQRNKQIIFIIAVYLLLTMSSHLTSDSTPFSNNIISIINNSQSGNPSIKTILSLFSVNNYQGKWNSININTLNILNNGQGKNNMKFQKFGTPQNIEYQFQFQINNGQYIDYGNILLRCVINGEMLESIRNGTSIYIKQKKQIIQVNNNTQQNKIQNNLTAFYRQQNILKTVQQKIIELSTFNINITYIQQLDKLQIYFIIKSAQLFSIKLSIQKQKSRMFSTILFAILLFIISYMQFSAIMQMLRAIFEGRQSAGQYSIITVLMATMWDAVICVVAFIQAFRNQQNLILFIMPAFLLCLLFTNLELRILLMIFQSRSNNLNIREIICKFNVITYGGLILMYPLLVYTNLSSFFFIAISLIIVPQIYTNAIQGQRPNIQNAYYSKFLAFRFMLIIYLKCFPWNIFQLQPNYFLGFTCLTLLVFQIFLLWIQKQYGPKKILPKFLLPPVFNYGCDMDINIQEGSQIGQCAICLASLLAEPEPGANNSLNIPFRIMRGPCGHKFHGTCLGQWMQIKMECPQCRAKLPPFQ